jgi:hypothetical protein
MKLSHLAFALCATLAVSPAWAQDNTAATSAKNDDLRDLDLLIVTGATMDANTLRWADEVNEASATGQSNDVGTLATIVVTGARLDANDRRWH